MREIFVDCYGRQICGAMGQTTGWLSLLSEFVNFALQIGSGTFKHLAMLEVFRVPKLGFDVAQREAKAFFLANPSCFLPC